jgi:hypothetical protein
MVFFDAGIGVFPIEKKRAGGYDGKCVAASRWCGIYFISFN